MINKVGSNINFKGTVYLGGKTKEQQEKLAQTISTFGVVDQNMIISGLKNLKKSLEVNTPDDQSYEINFQKGTVGQYKDQYRQLRTTYGGLSVMLLSVKPEGEAADIYYRTSEDVSLNKLKEATQFGCFGRTKAIKQIFSEAKSWIKLYDGYKEKDPQNEKEIASILNKLG